jgi:hypothetical protein
MKGGLLSKIVRDFLLSGQFSRGCGYFENRDEVVKYAEKTSQSQKRKWKRYGIIPAAFWQYLLEKRFIDPGRFIPEKYRTVKYLMDLLWRTPRRNRASRSEAEILRFELLKEMLPGFALQIGSAQHLYKKLEFYGDLPKKGVLREFKPNKEVVVIRKKRTA